MALRQGGRQKGHQFTSTILVTPKPEAWQYLSVDSTTYTHWKTTARSLSLKDGELASFLLQHYEKTADSQLTQCVKCAGPIVQYCMSCNIYMTHSSNTSFLQQEAEAVETTDISQDSMVQGQIMQLNVDAETGAVLGESQQVITLKVDDIMESTAGDGSVEISASSNQLDALVKACALQGAIMTNETGTVPERRQQTIAFPQMQETSSNIFPVIEPKLQRRRRTNKSFTTSEEVLPKLQPSPKKPLPPHSLAPNSLLPRRPVVMEPQITTSEPQSEEKITEAAEIVDESQLIAEAQALVDAQVAHLLTADTTEGETECTQPNTEAIPVTSETAQDSDSLAVDLKAESAENAELNVPSENQTEASAPAEIQAKTDIKVDKTSPDDITTQQPENKDEWDDDSDYYCEPLFKPSSAAHGDAAGGPPPDGSSDGKKGKEEEVAEKTEVTPPPPPPVTTPTPPPPLTPATPPQPARRSTRIATTTRLTARQLLNSAREETAPPSSFPRLTPAPTPPPSHPPPPPLQASPSKRKASPAKKTDSSPARNKNVDKQVVIIMDEPKEDPSLSSSSASPSSELQPGTNKTAAQGVKRKSKQRAPDGTDANGGDGENSDGDGDGNLKIEFDASCTSNTVPPRKRRRFSCKKGKSTYVCDICEDVSSSRLELKTHIAQRHGPRPYACKECPATYRCRSHLRVHVNCHADVKPFQCAKCPKAFASNYALKAHQVTHITERPNVCEVCGQSFKSLKYLKGHMRTHDPADKPFICQDCGVRFSRKSNLNNHIKIHNNDKRFQCPHCNKRFIQSGSMKSHVHRMHNPNRDRPYVCEICGQARFAKDQFEKHMMIHTGTKPFKCDVCGAAFVQSNALKGHMKIHNEQAGKSHWCSLCGAAFKKFASLKKHVHKVHNDYPEMSIATFEIIEMPVGDEHLNAIQDTVALQSPHAESLPAAQ